MPGPTGSKTAMFAQNNVTDVTRVGATTRSSLSRTPMETRVEDIRMYLEAVMSWINKRGDDIERCRLQMEDIDSVMELDEMWYFVPKKRPPVGSGSPMTGRVARVTACNLGNRKPVMGTVSTEPVCTNDDPVYGKLIPAERDVQTKAETGLYKH